MKKFLCFVAIAMVVGCSSPSSAIKVSNAEYGTAWPFMISEGILECQRETRFKRPLVTLNDGNGIMYGLNGAAQSFGFPTHRSILKPGRTGADVQRFIDRGLPLCP